MAAPTAQEQYQLELINHARIDPMGNAARYISSYSPLVSGNAAIQSALNFFSVSGSDLLAAFKALVPVQPLAWNSNLNEAASLHSAAMIAADLQSHQLPGELSLGDRLKAAGYVFQSGGENVYAYSLNDWYTHAGFMVDWGYGPGGMQSPAGHRDNIMAARFSEVGIDITAENDPATKVGPLVVTEDFGDRGLTFILGVAYTDRDGDNFYSIGEGRGDLKVSGASTSVTTFDSGGYSLQTAKGDQSFSFTGGGLSGAVRVTTTIASNLKIDIVNGDTLLTSGSVTVEGAIKVIKAMATGIRITAGEGDQKIVGSAGDDFLSGGLGNDEIIGNDGNDTLLGGGDNDILNGGLGADTIDGGAGIDTAVYAGTKSQYALTLMSGGNIKITGGTDGSDTLVGIEYFKFSDGTYAWDAATGRLSATPVTGTGTANAAPVVTATQSVTTNEDTAKQVTVSATDANNDVLTFTAGLAAHGTVSGGANGVFTYTPTANYAGNDTFVVTVSDGKGGTASQTVSVSVTAVNDAPTVSATQSVTTAVGTAKQFTVSGSDVDGDVLSYQAGPAGHGSVANNGNGSFTYTPSVGYNGSDSVVVTVSDGKGGTATQTVNFSVQVAPPPPSQSLPPSEVDFRMFAGDGFKGAAGGTGFVYGSNSFQDVSFNGEAGSVEFDASFNKGGDIIRLPGNAGTYTIKLVGSAAVLNDGDTTYTIPVGTLGTALVFGDGVRKLVYDATSQTVKIGSQAVGSVAGIITAPTDGMPLPTGANANALASTFLEKNADVTLGGDQKVFGTSGGEKLHYLYGDITLDPSFNKGGDTLYLNNIASTHKAYLEGSTLVLIAAGGDIRIPVGTSGMGLDFNGSSYALRYDAVSGKVMVGEFAITATTRVNAQTLDSLGASAGTEKSIDVGDAGTTVEINLDANGTFTLTDSASKNTNVKVTGFGQDDVINVTGATAGDYNFSTGDADNDGKADDLNVSYSNNGIVTLISLIDAVNNTGLVFNYDTAAHSIGSDFMHFA